MRIGTSLPVFLVTQKWLLTGKLSLWLQAIRDQTSREWIDAFTSFCHSYRQNLRICCVNPQLRRPSIFPISYTPENSTKLLQSEFPIRSTSIFLIHTTWTSWQSHPTRLQLLWALSLTALPAAKSRWALTSTMLLLRLARLTPEMCKTVWKAYTTIYYHIPQTYAIFPCDPCSYKKLETRAILEFAILTPASMILLSTLR